MTRPNVESKRVFVADSAAITLAHISPLKPGSAANITPADMVKLYTHEAQNALGIGQTDQTLAASRKALKLLPRAVGLSRDVVAELFACRGAALNDLQDSGKALQTLKGGLTFFQDAGGGPTGLETLTEDSIPKLKLSVELGRAYRELKRFDEASCVLHDAIGLIEQHAKDVESSPKEIQSSVCSLHIDLLVELGRIELDGGDADSALDALKKPLEILARSRELEVELISCGQRIDVRVVEAKVLADKAVAHYLKNEFDSSFAILNQAENLLKDRLSDSSKAVLEAERFEITDTFGACLERRAFAANESGQCDLAGAAYLKALQNRMQLFGPSHPSTQFNSERFAEFQAQEGYHNDAVQLYTQAIDAMLFRNGGTFVDTPDTVKEKAAFNYLACSASRLELALSESDKESGAETLNLAAQDLAEAGALAEDCSSASLNLLAALNEQDARFLISGKKYELALAKLDQAIRYRLMDPSNDHGAVAHSLFDLSCIAGQRRSYRETFRLQLENLVTFVSTLDESTRPMAQVLLMQGLLTMAYQLEEGGKKQLLIGVMMRRAYLSLCGSHYGHGSKEYGKCQLSIADNLSELGVADEALKHLDEALEQFPTGPHYKDFLVRARSMQADIVMSKSAEEPVLVKAAYERVFKLYTRGFAANHLDFNDDIRRYGRYLLDIEPGSKAAAALDIPKEITMLRDTLVGLQSKNTSLDKAAECIRAADTFFLAEVAHTCSDLVSAGKFYDLAVEHIRLHSRFDGQLYLEIHLNAGMFFALLSSTSNKESAPRLRAKAIALLASTRSASLHRNSRIDESLEEKLLVHGELLRLYREQGDKENEATMLQKVQALQRQIDREAD